jgi:hypothetical protein
MNEHAQNVLTAGGAPWRWQREMKRGVTRLDALHRASAWIGPFVATLGGLCRESIFGDCLASILAGTENTAGSMTAPGRGSRPRFTGPLESEVGERRAGNNEPEPLTERTVQFSLRREEAWSALNELPRQAEHELLRRLADVLPASTKIRGQHSNPASSRLNAPERYLFRQTSEVGPTRGASASASAQAQPPFELPLETLEAAQRGWQDELVKRIKRVISLAEPPRIKAAELEHDLLAWPWSTPFSGPTAPSELLAYWSNPPQRDRGASNDNGHARAGARSLSKEQKNGARAARRNLASTNSSSNSQITSNSTANGSWPNEQSRESSNSFGNTTSAGRESMMPSTQEREQRQGAGDDRAITNDPAARRRSRSFTPAAESLLSLPHTRVNPSWSEYWEPLMPPEDNFDPRMEDDPSTSGWAGQIEPPTTAPQLPPLIPPQMVGMPVLPIAAATARHGARDEETADEDLDVLADRIKRILDEEARRHGIDV